MQICSEERPSGLMTVFLRADSKLNLGTKLAREWCQEREKIKDPVCEIASHLFPHCKVIGGDEKVSHKAKVFIVQIIVSQKIAKPCPYKYLLI